jgi:ADP-heptose:LPS heptosyltransferase
MKAPKKILAIQLKRAGDVVVATPVAPLLRERFPEAEIAFLVDKPFAALLHNNPFIDRVEVFDSNATWETWRRLAAERYDWVLDFQSSPRSVLAGLATGAPVRAGYAVPFWGRFFTASVPRPRGSQPVTQGKLSLVEALLGPVGRSPERRIFLEEPERAWAAALITPKPSGEGVIGLVPTHRHASRRWHGRQFAQLGRLLMERGFDVWWFWGPGEEAYVEALEREAPGSRRIPKTSFRQMAALFERCRLVISNDNGPMHLAVAAGVPTVTVYGPTDPVNWNPGGPRHTVVRAEGLSCLACNLNRCPFGHECMSLVSPEKVLAHSLVLLQKPVMDVL